VQSSHWIRPLGVSTSELAEDYRKTVSPLISGFFSESELSLGLENITGKLGSEIKEKISELETFRRVKI